jgi:hypothetical protein
MPYDYDWRSNTFKETHRKEPEPGKDSPVARSIVRLLEMALQTPEGSLPSPSEGEKGIALSGENPSPTVSGQQAKTQPKSISAIEQLLPSLFSRGQQQVSQESSTTSPRTTSKKTQEEIYVEAYQNGQLYHRKVEE